MFTSMQLSPDDKRVLVVSIIKALTAVLQDNKQAQVSQTVVATL